MTVGELIEALRLVPADTRVVMVHGTGDLEVEDDIVFVTAGEIGGGTMQVELS